MLARGTVHRGSRGPVDPRQLVERVNFEELLPLLQSGAGMKPAYKSQPAAPRGVYCRHPDDKPEYKDFTEGWRYAAALASNTTLISLEVTFCPTRLGTALATALRHNRTLQSISLAGDDLDDEVGVALAASLVTNRTLRHFSLSGEKLGDCLVTMAHALDRNSTLESFSFTGQIEIGSGSWVASLPQALGRNSTLHSFELALLGEGRQRTDDFCAALASALNNNSTLRSFRLMSLGIGEEGGIALAGTLKRNSSLQSIDFSWCFAREGAQMALAEALEHNTTLLHLGTPVNVCAKVKKAVQQSLRRNRTLRGQWLTLALLARDSGDTGFRSLADLTFRRRLFEFYLPANCPPKLLEQITSVDWMKTGGDLKRCNSTSSSGSSASDLTLGTVLVERC